MTNFDADTLRALRDVQEPMIRTEKHPESAVVIWVVVAGDEVFVRSWRGDKGRWYRDLAAGGPPRWSLPAAGCRCRRSRRATPRSVERASREYPDGNTGTAATRRRWCVAKPCRPRCGLNRADLSPPSADGLLQQNGASRQWKSNETAHSRPARGRPTISPARSASTRCSRRRSGARPWRQRHVRARRAHGLAHASARPDADRHGRLRLGAARGRTGRGNPAGRCGLVLAGREALARRRRQPRR